MKLWILSDLHFESNGHTAVSASRMPDADVCILAGDIDEGPAAAVEWARKEIAWRMPVVYVAGNHEFYGAGWKSGWPEAARPPKPRSRAASTVCTCWKIMTSFSAVSDSWARRCGRISSWKVPAFQQLFHDAAAGLMLDYQLIWTDRGRLLTPDDTRGRYWSSVLWLEKALSLPVAGPTVVVTHTAPSSRSIATRYEGSVLNGAFVNDLDYLFEFDWAPDLWVHGHVHQSFDYRFGGTRVVCNPLGYTRRPDEQENGFELHSKSWRSEDGLRRSQA